MIKEAESRIHADLTKILNRCASNEGYRDLVELPSSLKPDIIRLKKVSVGSKLCKFLFVGDAKVAANETAQNKESANRISKYLDEFFELIKTNEISGGIFAVITDREEEAEGWAELLKEFVYSEYGYNFCREIAKTSSGLGWIAYLKINRHKARAIRISSMLKNLNVYKSLRE